MALRTQFKGGGAEVCVCVMGGSVDVCVCVWGGGELTLENKGEGDGTLGFNVGP